MEITNGTVAVVTGAGSGIGLAMADAFARAGASVVLADVQQDALDAAVAQVAAHGGETMARTVDVSDPDQVEALATATVERFGGVHIVCNNAGVAGGGDPWTGPLDGWEWVLGVNLWGVIHGVRSFLPRIAMSGGGHIVNTASMAGLLPGFSPAYDVSKHGVVAMSEGLFRQLREADFPIGVSCLCPGWVRTGILDSERNWPAEYGAVPETDAAGQIARDYVRRAIDEGMQPAAVADMVLEAIRTPRFWVFPHPDFVEIAAERFQTIVEGLDPQPREQTPGMPPRSQIMAEVVAALAGEQPAES